MLKVWIAGSAGQIGTAINQVLDPMEMEVFNTDKNELDITQTDEVLRFGEINRPNIIINCAAITDTALCEQEPELAFRVNALGARNLSIVCLLYSSRLTMFSMVSASSRTRNLISPIRAPFTDVPSLPANTM